MLDRWAPVPGASYNARLIRKSMCTRVYHHCYISLLTCMRTRRRRHAISALAAAPSLAVAAPPAGRTGRRRRPRRVALSTAPGLLGGDPRGDAALPARAPRPAGSRASERRLRQSARARAGGATSAGGRERTRWCRSAASGGLGAVGSGVGASRLPGEHRMDFSDRLVRSGAKERSRFELSSVDRRLSVERRLASRASARHALRSIPACSAVLPSSGRHQPA